MALEDRERNFEKALRREFRAKSESGLDCPDAEALAAYHERMLSPEEMSRQKTHIAACPRCQEILATLEVTEAIPSGAEDSEKVLAKARDLAGTSRKSASLREMPRRNTHLRWAVPAGAIAAGLLVWIAFNSSRSAMMRNQTAPAMVRENREQKDQPLQGAKPELEARAPASEMADKVSGNERDDSKEELEASAARELAKGQGNAEGKTMSRGRASAPPYYEHGPRQVQNQAQNQMQYQIQRNGQVVAQNQPTEFDKMAGIPSPGKNAPAAQEENSPRRSEQAMKAAPPPSPPVPAAATAKPNDGTAGKQQKDLEVQPMTETVVVTGADASISTDEKADKNASAALKKLKAVPSSGGMTAANVRDLDSGGRGLVQTSDPKVFWFFTASGMIVKTEDGGKTTHLQKTVESIKLLAGSAPDAKTCWLLAEKGMVLRTNNGGKKWATLSTPPDVNFTTITAFDAMHALIMDRTGDVSYSTTDGGATWKAVPRQ